MLKDRTQTLYLAYHLRRLNNRLEGFFGQVYEMIEGKRPVPEPDEPPTPENTQDAIKALHQLHGVLSRILNLAKCRRLTNYSLLSAQVRMLARLEEEAGELADWFEMAVLQQEQTKDVFDRARAEKEQGDVYDLSQIE